LQPGGDSGEDAGVLVGHLLALVGAAYLVARRVDA
jgi:hypothetical protein